MAEGLGVNRAKNTLFEQEETERAVATDFPQSFLKLNKLEQT
jgi:hypothetical protein